MCTKKHLLILKIHTVIEIEYLIDGHNYNDAISKNIEYD